MKKKLVYLLGIFSLAAILYFVTLYKPYNNGPAIRSDGSGYHLWTHMIKAQDFGSCRYLGHMYDDIEKDGFCENKYPAGVALFRLPVMWSKVNEKINPPHISNSEHEVVLRFGAALLIAIYLLLLQISRWQGLSAYSSTLIIWTMIFGTGLFHYATYDASYSHIYSTFFGALLLNILARKKYKDIDPNPFLLIFIFSFMILIRSTNIVALFFISILFLYISTDMLKARKLSISMIIGTLLGTLFLMLSNYFGANSFSISGYGKESFIWDRPMFWSVLFSYERGVFTFYPSLLVPFIFGFMNSKTRILCLGTAVLFISYATLYGYWHSWHLAGGFGHRGFIILVPFACCLFFVSLKKYSAITQNRIASVALLSAVPTVWFMRGYWMSLIPFSGTDSKLYWSYLKLLIPHW